jgi:hypothetical protein
VEEINELTPEKLKPYVRKSGLKSSNEWLEALRKFTKDKAPKSVYLYRVDLIPFPRIPLG